MVVAHVPPADPPLLEPQALPVPATTPFASTWRHWSEPVIPEKVTVPVAVSPATLTLPVIAASPTTESFAYGDVVPMPTFPSLFIISLVTSPEAVFVIKEISPLV